MGDLSLGLVMRGSRSSLVPLSTEEANRLKSKEMERRRILRLKQVCIFILEEIKLNSQ